MRKRSAQAAFGNDADAIDWTGHATLDSLSSELLDRIIYELAIISPKRNVLRLLTVRPLHFAALRWTWRRLAFDLAQVDRNERLLDALNKRPVLGEHIRRISLRRAPFSTMRPGRTDLERSIDLMSKAPALTDLEIRSRLRHTLDSQPPELEERLGAAFVVFSKTLKRLILTPPLAEAMEDVENGNIPVRLPMTKSYALAFSSFSRLTALDLWEVSFEHMPIAEYTPPSFRLVNLAMSKLTFTGAGLLWLLSSTMAAGSLTDLAMNQVGSTDRQDVDQLDFIDASFSFLTSVAPSLHNLALSKAPKGFFSNEELTIPFFKRLDRLQSLTLESVDVLPASMNMLPAPSLREPASVTSLVEKLQPALRRVFITTFQGIQPGSPELTRWPWSKSDLRLLRSLCVTNGFWLEVDGVSEANLGDLESSDEAEPAAPPTDDVEDLLTEAPYWDDLFVLDDERRARWEEERHADFALLEEAKQRGDSSSQDEFMDALTSEDDIL